MTAETDVVCPLCGDRGFDAFGFVLHIKNGWCETAVEAEQAGQDEERQRYERRVASLKKGQKE